MQVAGAVIARKDVNNIFTKDVIAVVATQFTTLTFPSARKYIKIRNENQYLSATYNLILPDSTITPNDVILPGQIITINADGISAISCQANAGAFNITVIGGK